MGVSFAGIRIEQLGLEGYGIFWVLVETLRDQPNYRYPLKLISALARKYNTTTEKMKAVICSYDLFSIENDLFFFSESLINRMKILEDRRKVRSDAGKKGNEIRWKDKIALQSHSDNIAIVSKEKENKEKNNIFFEEEKRDLRIEGIPPDDETHRNFKGLCDFLKEVSISRKEANEIILRSNYGEKNHPVWSAIWEVQKSLLRNGKYKIELPGRFILTRI